MLNNITPVLLTLNEFPNVGRALDKLDWAEDIVVVDSFSADGTVDLIKRHPKVRVFQRKFDTHASQWNYAIHETGVGTPWVLALDADYILSDSFVDELKTLNLDSPVTGYQAPFRYCILGKPLRGALYQPVTVLFKAEGAEYRQDGHTQRIQVQGKVSVLESEIYHDDRKSLSQWLQAQDRYMELETAIIDRASWGELNFPDQIRKLIIVAPILIFFYCYLFKGGILDGRIGLYYSMQRALAEVVLSLKLLLKKIGYSE